MKPINPMLFKDFYKANHRIQYPPKTELVYSNFTPRESRIPGVNQVVVFGVQYFVKEFLQNNFNENFFNKPLEEVLKTYKRRMDTSLGPNAVSTDHIQALWNKGYLPLEIKALDEGTLVPLRVPVLTIQNTDPDFFWLTNFVETLLSNALWHPMTSATIAYEYRKILQNYANKTSDIPELVQWQGHDFSMRGQSSLESSMVSGAGHLLSFTGTDTIPAIDFLENYYEANAEKELIGGSVAATEHSVMCMGGNESELATYRRLITDVQPNGIISIVSDTWDYWGVLTKVLPALKDQIMKRDGKLVIRPDSGNPADIICGDPSAPVGSPASLGTAQILWNLFGGTTNSKGYKQLDSHIGMIYGDSITLEVCEDINQRLMALGFASTNMVYGIGSYTYQYVTRDTFGFAVKSTYGIVDGEARNIFKDPQTDKRRNVKKSACGLLRVNEDLTLSEKVTPDEANTGLLKTVFLNGVATRPQSLSQIREKLLSNLK